MTIADLNTFGGELPVALPHSFYRQYLPSSLNDQHIFQEHSLKDSKILNPPKCSHNSWVSVFPNMEVAFDTFLHLASEFLPLKSAIWKLVRV